MVSRGVTGSEWNKQGVSLARAQGTAGCGDVLDIMRCSGEVRKGLLFSDLAGGGGESGSCHKQPGDRVEQQAGH